MNDSIADRDGKLAMLMAMTGNSVEEAACALDESGGDVDQAMVRLNSNELSGGGDTTKYSTKMIQTMLSVGKSTLRSSNFKQPNTRLRRPEADFDDPIPMSPNPRPAAEYEENGVAASTFSPVEMRKSAASGFRSFQDSLASTWSPGTVISANDMNRNYAMVNDECTMAAPAASTSPEDSMELLTDEVAPATDEEYKLLQAQIEEHNRMPQRNTAIASEMTCSINNEAQSDPVDDDEDSNNNKPLCSLRILTIAVAIVLLICIGAVLGAVFSRNQKMRKVAPTDAPTAAPTSVIDGVTQLISSVSFDGGEALQNPSTPQNMALNWLVENKNLDLYSDEKKIQRYVLATLYYSTLGKNWDGNDDWVTDTDECNWYSKALGSFCINGAVAQLDFYNSVSGGNNLVGAIPAEVALLSDSVVLMALGDNSLNGQIPSEIGLMSQLTALYLWGNVLTGTIPSEILLLPKLTELSLSNNKLMGVIPSEIGSMTTLESLALHANELRGSFPSEIGLLTSMTSLTLYENVITGRIPSEIGVSSNISLINIFDTDLMGSIPSEIGMLTKLTFLNLQSNSLTGTIPSELESLTGLYFLGLNGNSFSGNYKCPVVIGGCCILCCDLIGEITPDDENFDSPCREI